MKKFYFYICLFFVIFSMISTVTALPKINSDPIMNKINMIEENGLIISEKISYIKINLENSGLIDLLIRIIQWLITLVERIIDLVLEIFILIEILNYLIELISSLFDAILDLINKIFEIFNP